MRFKIVVGILYVVFAFMVLGCKGQTKKPSPMKPIHFAESPSPARKMALGEIRALDEYLHDEGEPTTYTISESNSEQSFSVDVHGHIELNNISLEDAFLVLVGEQARKTLEELKASPQVLQPQQEFDQWTSEEKASVPPTKLKDGNKVYTVKQVVWLGGDLETTDCKNKEIDVLMSDGAKRAGMMHEMMHVATGCDLKTPGLHQAIYKLAGPLLKLMQENPEMMDYLLKRKSIASTSGYNTQINYPSESQPTFRWDEECGMDNWVNGNPVCGDPPIPVVVQEPVTQPVYHCPDGWHVEVWYEPITATWNSETKPFIYYPEGHYGPYSKPIAFSDYEDKDHPAKCVKNPDDKH